MHAGLNRNAKRRCLRYSVVVRSQDSASLAEEGQEIQWDYKNIVRRKGKLQRLK